MSFTFNVKGAHGGGGSGLNSIAVTLAGINVNDIIIIGLKHETNATTAHSIADSGGSGSASTFSLDPDGLHSSGSHWTIMGYTLASQRSGTVTYTISFSGGPVQWCGICAIAYTPSATPTFEDSNFQSTTSDGSGNIASTSITVSADNLVIGFFGEVAGTAASSTKVNTVASDQAVTDTDTGQGDTMWSKTNASGFTGTVTAVIGASQAYICTAMGFKITGGGGSSPTYPQLERGVRGLHRGIAS